MYMTLCHFTIGLRKLSMGYSEKYGLNSYVPTLEEAGAKGITEV